VRGHVEGGNQEPRVEGVAAQAQEADEAVTAKANQLRLGAPTGPLERIGRTGFGRAYGGTRVYWSTRTRPHEVHGAILERYLGEGGPDGWLGFPKSDEQSAGSAHGRQSIFQFGTLLWEPEKGTHEIHGSIRDEWLRLGGDQWGMPVTDELPCPDGVGVFNHFWHTGTEDRSIYYHPETGARAVGGQVRPLWSKLGWEGGWLGYPDSDAQFAPARFQKGSVLTTTLGGSPVALTPLLPDANACVRELRVSPVGTTSHPLTAGDRRVIGSRARRE
jgi:uncharacterized protein with LGFP repeats